MPEEVTLGEVYRNLQDLKIDLRSQITEVKHQMEGLQYVPIAVYEARHRILDDRVTALEDSKTWLTRAIVVSILFPVLVAIVVALVVSRG